MSNLTQLAIPSEKSETTQNKVAIKCNGEVGENTLQSQDYEVLFPTSVGKKFLLSGGSILKIDFSNLGIESTEEAADKLSRFVNQLKENKITGKDSSSIQQLVSLRKEINQVLFSIGRRDSRVLQKDNTEKKAPSIYISAYNGTGEIPLDKFDQRVNRICSIRFIPSGNILSIIEKIREFEDLEGIIGSSGREIISPDESTSLNLNSEEGFVNTLIELFPIFKIDPETILSNEDEIIGGFYTISDKDDAAYFKLPDLSGQSSSGIPGFDYFGKENLQLFIEVETSDNIARIPVEPGNVVPVPEFIVVSADGDAPNQDFNTEIKIFSDVDLTSGDYEVCLSAISDDQDYKLAKQRGLNTDAPLIELFTAPVLTQRLEDRKSIYESESFSPLIDFKNTNFLIEDNQVGLQLPNVEERDKSFYEENGYPLTSPNNFINDFVGEMNRPDLILANFRTEGTAKQAQKIQDSNDRVYHKSGSNGAYNLLVSNRIRYYPENLLPSSWIRIDSSNIKKEGIFYIASLTKEAVSDFNLDNPNRFIIYVYDKVNGQIFKEWGVRLKIEKPDPEITSLEPVGDEENFEIRLGSTANFTLNLEDVDDGEIFISIVDAGGNIIVPRETVEINAGQASFEVEIIAPDFTAQALYYFIIDDGTRESVRKGFYVSISEEAKEALTEAGEEEPSPESPAPVEFKKDNFSASIRGRTSFNNIPIIYQNVSLEIKSKAKIFKKSNFSNDDGGKIFAYLAFAPDDRAVLESFASSENIFDVNTSGIESAPSNLIVSADMSYVFDGESLDPTSSFARINNKKAVLKFPGNDYLNRNFDKLSEIDSCYILITSRRIDGIETFSDIDGGVVPLGIEQSPFFFGPEIVGIIGEGRFDPTPVATSDFYISQITSGSKIDRRIKKFFGDNIAVGNINISEVAKKFAIVFKAHDKLDKKARLKFFIGDKDISKNRVGDIKINEAGTLGVATFRGVSIAEEGYQNVYIQVQDKEFGLIYDLKTLERRISYNIPENFYTEDEGTVILTRALTEYLANFRFSGVLISDEVLSPLAEEDTVLEYGFYNPITISPSILTEFSLSRDIFNDNFTIDAGLSEEVNSLGIFKADLISGSSFPLSDGLVDQEGSILYASKIEISNQSSVQWNVPEITQIEARGFTVLKASIDDYETSQTEADILDLLGQKIFAGEEIIVRAKGVKKNFVVVFSTNTNQWTVEPNGKTKRVGPGIFEGKFTVPNALAGAQLSADGTIGCLKISASGANNKRNRAKKSLGGDLFNDLDNGIQRLTDGASKHTTAKVNELKDKAESFPLRYVNVKIKDTTESVALLNSFCDWSYGMTVNLKVALDGFQTLLIPVKIIFCIIDVICALINPFALIFAIIRLFQCLYDLIALLPQISVPVMFLSLVLHVVTLLECLFTKIIETIIVINEIITAIDTAVQDTSVETILALEQVLSEYLLKIEADLQFLGPVMSILAIFLELLQLIFRFPCSISPTDDDEGLCGIDGSLLAGLIAGRAAGSGTIDPSFLIPATQPYFDGDIDEADNCTPLAVVTMSTDDVIAEKDSETTYLESINYDEDTLRGTNAGIGNIDKNTSHSFSVTRIAKKFGNPQKVRFSFKSKYEKGTASEGVIANYNVDSPIYTSKVENNQFLIPDPNEVGNIISFIDEYEFLEIESSFPLDIASVKPLQLQLDIPQFNVDETTGDLIQTGTETVFRTFDGVPSMAIMDDEFNLYFIEENGIKIDGNQIIFIDATIINTNAANPRKFDKESGYIKDNEEQTDCDGGSGTLEVISYPQIYFVDVRQAEEDIEQMCANASINSFLFDNNDIDDIEDIVDTANDCLTDYIQNIQNIVNTIRNSIANGEVPSAIDLAFVEGLNDDVVECLNGTIDDMCKYVVNSLNTSFKILEDEDETDLESFPDISLSDEILDGFASLEPALTGAREYASGIGDSTEITVGNKATIEIIPRDSYDLVIEGDIYDKIDVTIVSDTTGDARFVLNDNNDKITTNSDFSYTVQITSDIPGVVKVRGRICEQTIQAITYAGIDQENINPVSSLDEVDCVPDAPSIEEATAIVPIGNLQKIDRILTIFFVNKDQGSFSGAASNNPDRFGDGSAQTDPQEYGTILEN